MRQLLPHPLPEVDLVASYAFPNSGPWVRANMIASADGAATLHGRAGGLGNEPDRVIFGLVRQLADVILVGAETVRVEKYGPEPPKPGDVARRQQAGQSPAPAIAVVSRRLDLDPGADLFTSATSRTVVITCSSAPVSARHALAEVAEVIVAGATSVDLAIAVHALHERGFDRISCEGGPTLLAQLAAARRLDELCLTYAPVLVGGGSLRILDGVALDPAQDLQLVQLLEEDGYLFARYLLNR